MLSVNQLWAKNSVRGEPPKSVRGEPVEPWTERRHHALICRWAPDKQDLISAALMIDRAGWRVVRDVGARPSVSTSPPHHERFLGNVDQAATVRGEPTIPFVV